MTRICEGGDQFVAGQSSRVVAGDAVASGLGEEHGEPGGAGYSGDGHGDDGDGDGDDGDGDSDPSNGKHTSVCSTLHSSLSVPGRPSRWCRPMTTLMAPTAEISRLHDRSA